jgi:hypothetical protein
MTRKLSLILSMAVLAIPSFAQQKKAPASPPASAEVAINGKNISIKYSAPSVRSRQIFGEGGVVSKDANYPVWRAGANAATAFHTDADLDLNGLQVPKGDYTLYVLVKDPAKWQLIVNKQTGQWGLTYSQAQDLGRVPMNMSKPPAPIETLKITLSSEGGNRGKLQMEWDTAIASVPFTVK